MAAVAATVLTLGSPAGARCRPNRQGGIQMQDRADTRESTAESAVGSTTSAGRRLKTVLDLDDLCLDLDSDFAVTAFQHLSEAVQDLAAEHNRRMAILRSEMDRKLKAATEGKSMEAAPFPSSNESPLSEPPPPVADGDQCDGEEARFPVVPVFLENEETSSARATDRQSSEDIEVIARNLEGSKPQEEFLQHKVSRFVLSPKFDTFIGAVIVLNTFCMSLELEYQGRVFKDEILDKCTSCDVRNRRMEDFLLFMEHLFTSVFALELFLRLVFEGCSYLASPSNFLDAAIVLVSMVDSWVLGPLGSDVLGNIAVLRLIRLLRLAKILRVVRVMKAFKSLRVLVAAVVNSVGALGWSMTLLFVLELVGAIFMAQVIQPFMDKVPETAEAADLQKFIWNSFGTWTNAMFTIFEITMAPGGFIKYRRLYEEVHPLFGMFFVLYVCVVTFAVVRVITAMFLKATLSASDTEDHDAAKQKSVEWTNYIEAFGASKDEGETQTLTVDDVKDLCSIDHFALWLQEVGLHEFEVTRMFNALGQGADKVALSEFAHAMQQMSGLPRSANIVLNLYETRAILSRVTRLEAELLEVSNQA